jgi:Putative prokaryotic signal transducing protein
MFRVAIPVSKRYHAHPMTQIDPEKEHQRLAARYAAMQDDELEKVALDFPSLTDAAKSALHSEMSRRDLTPPAEIAANHANEIAQSEARKPVMIRRYRDLPEASIAKSVVESAGIDCILADDNLVRLDWFYSNLVGGIKLLVPEKDADAAVQLLDESTPEKFAVEGVGEYEQPRCPKCGSMDVSLDGLNKPLTIAATYITSLPIPVTTTGWKCHPCGHQWNEGGEVGSSASSPGEQTN